MPAESIVRARRGRALALIGLTACIFGPAASYGGEGHSTSYGYGERHSAGHGYGQGGHALSFSGGQYSKASSARAPWKPGYVSLHKAGTEFDTYQIPGGYGYGQQANKARTTLVIPRLAVWRDDKLFYRSESEIIQALELGVGVAKRLRKGDRRLHDSVLSIRTAENPSWLLARPLTGDPLSALPSNSAGKAKDAANEMLKLARETAVGVHLPAKGDYFRFRWGTGDVSAWLLPSGLPEGVALPIEKVSQLKGGANSEAYRVKSSDPRYSRFGVLKVLRPYSERREPEVAVGDVMFKLGEVVVKTADKLRADKGFRKVAGDVVPEVMMLQPGVLLQEAGKGVSFDELSHHRQEHARDRIKEIAAAAIKVLGDDLVVSARTRNFLYDKDTGEPSCWYDHLSDGKVTYAKKNKPRVLELR